MTRNYLHDETLGLVNQVDKNKNKKLFFFEIDNHTQKDLDLVLVTYKKYNLTVLFHPTKMGYHFISPTLLTLDEWKTIHKELIHLNRKCPMITLRCLANKYENESDYFYTYEVRNDSTFTDFRNVKSVCTFLNKTFGSDIIGKLKGEIQTVKYIPCKDKMK